MLQAAPESTSKEQISDGKEGQTNRDINGSLAAQSFQRGPRHIWHNVPASINQPNICGLHECVDKNHFKNAFLLSACYVLAFLRSGEFCSS